MRDYDFEPKCECLIKGEVFNYDLVVSVSYFNEHKMSFVRKGFKYIGKGTLHSMGGQVDKSKNKPENYYWVYA